MRPKFTTDKVLISGIALLLATIIFIIVISYFQSRRVNDTAKLVEHSQEVLLHSQKLSSAILDNETESRGYVITGQQIFLAPLQKSQIAINQELSTLKSLTKQHAAVQARLDSLSYYSNKRVQFSNSLIAVRDKNAQAAMAMVETGEGKLYTDRIHFLIQNIQDIENDLLTERRQINEKKIATFNGILATVIIAVLILIGIFIQKTRKDFFEKRKATEELKKLNSELEQRVAERTDELLQSKNALAETFERIDDGFIALDKNWNYTYINKWAGKITYRTPESLLGKNVWEEFPAAVGSATYNLFQKVMKEQVYEFNTDYFEPLDLWQENHVYPASNGIVVFIRDISERKRAEQKIFKANRLYFFISQINQMIVRTTDEETLFTKACEIAVDLGKFRMAWIGMIDQRTKKVIPAKHAGEENGFLTKVKHMAFDEAQLASPIAQALSRGEYVIFNDIENDPQMAVWKEAALERGYRSLMALPITKFGTTIGVFSFYASEKNYFDEAEIALLLEATGDVSFALENFEKENLRTKAEAEVVQSEMRYHTLAEVSPVGIFHADADGATTYVNPRWCQMSGISFEEAMGFGWYKALHQQDRDNIKTNWEKATVNHQPSLSEYRFVQPDGTVRWVMGQAIPEKDNNGNIVGYVGTATDITERKNAELELTESEEKYRVLFYHNPMPSWIIEKDGIAILDANDAALELYGYTREEFLALNVMQLRPQEEYIKYQQHSATMQEAPVEGNIGMWRHIKKDGSPVDVELRAHSIVFNKLPCRMIMAIDITEQKKAEEEIKKSNERFELIARATSDVIWDWNLLTNHLWWNDNYYSLFGYDKLLTAPDINSWVNGIHPDDREWVTKTIYQAIDTGKTSWTEEYRYFKNDGSTLYIYDRGYVLHDVSGKPYRVIGSMLDVTERKKIEQTIRQSEEKYRTLVEQATDAIFIADATGKFITVNSSAVKLSQYSEAELLQKTVQDFDVLEDFQKNPIHFQQLRQGKSVTSERIMKRKDGILRNVEVIGKLLSDGRLLVFVRDISERLKAQNEILKEKNLSDSIINSLPGIFYLYNKEGKFLRWNTNFEAVSGYSHQEVSNMHPLDFFAEDEKELLLEKITNVFVSGEENVQANFLTKTKEKIPFYFTGIAIDYEGTTCLMGVGLDFSERIKAQEEIKETSEKLRQLTAHLLSVREEERKRIGREIHDELGQQLTAIKMDVSWIDKKIPASTILIKTKLKNIIELLDGSNHAIRRILSELRPAALDDYGLREALEWLNSQFTNNTGIPVIFDIEETIIKIPEEIATCIFRVYQEAFTNITRYAQAKNVHTSLAIEDNIVTVTIKDDGKGFDIIFLKTKKSFGILGMKERVFSVGGEFELVSAPGKGTAITISIPFKF